MRAAVGVAAVLVSLGGATALGGKSAAGIEARQQALELEWSRELDVKKHISPVRRVVNLLNKMREQLDAEANKESEMYDSMVCWCQTNEKEKTQAVAEAEAEDTALSSEIEERAARFGQLGTTISQLKVDNQANKDTLDKAVAIREDEAGKFRDMEKELVQYVANLRNAITVLSKHQGSSMLQLDSSLMLGLRVLLRDAALKYDLLAAGREERSGSVHIALLALGDAHSTEGAKDQQSAALLQALNSHSGSVSDSLPVKFAQEVIARAAAGPSGAFLQKQPIFESRSSARSSNIFGVLQRMQEEFEEELSTAQKEEVTAQADFKELAAAKSAEIDVGKTKLDDMEVEHAGNQKALSDAKENLGLARQQRSEDVEFLRNLKLTCNDLDDQWQKRSKTRGAETQAVAEAIAILTEDDNREHLANTVSFLELASDSESVTRARRVSAAAALRRAAQAPNFDADDLLAAWNSRSAAPASVGAAAGPRAQLAVLATAVQLDAFTRVKELMDKMIVDLKDQQSEEVKFKDHCTNELDTTDKDLHDKGEMKNDLEGNIDRLDNLIQKMESDIQEHRTQMASAQTEVKRAGQQREQDNKKFQTVVADQRATQEILAKALIKLKDFYQKNIGKAVLLQGAKQSPPVQFNDYKASAGSNPAIGLLEQIIGDSKGLEAEATEGETEAQMAYETFAKDSNGLIGILQESVTKKTQAIAASKGEHASANADLESTVDELESLSAYEADLHARCDFLLKNFNIRQQARLKEIEAIQQAKAILSGAQ